MVHQLNVGLEIELVLMGDANEENTGNWCTTFVSRYVARIYVQKNMKYFVKHES